MKTFEEKLTAWIDGELTGRDCEEFEKELNAQPEAAVDAAIARRIGELLREHRPEAVLKNADFFNHQLMQRIAAEEPAGARAADSHPSVFPLGRLAWFAAFCLAMAAGLYESAVSKGPYQNKAESHYLAEILDAKPGNSNITATAFHAQKTGVTVLWLDGMDYLPESYDLK
jgi:anti-sigma factor RsiW